MACPELTHYQKWDGKRFVRDRRWLQKLNLRVQLGHRPGVVCTFRHAAPQDFVLYDLNGVHEINVDFCGCLRPDGTPVPRNIQLLRACWWPATVLAPNTCATFSVLRLFQVLNCLGKVSAYDFIRSLEKCTNHDGLDKPPDRRKPFMHIMRQWREVKRMKRARRGHDAGGVRGTKKGELVLTCRACPQPYWNLPAGWENVSQFYRFIYFLFLAQDANFRLSNRNVSSEEAHPIWGDGMGYFCKREGDDGYKAHIAKHVDEKEMSNCSGFQAMFMANTKRVKGLRTTGIGGVTCSRHNMWRANGMGDLQVGERQCNMDFLLLSAVDMLILRALIVSYDIACQYGIRFWERMLKMPEAMRLKINQDDLWWKVPNFHLPPHKPRCHCAYSFHWMFGAGMTHGEGVEQNWSFSNGAAPSTRLMGPGSRNATLEDVFGFHNYDRQLAMRKFFKILRAMCIHKVAFNAFSKGLEEARPDQVQDWKEWVDRWEAKQHTDSTDCPFELAEVTVTTMRDIQLLIATEEFVCTDDGVEIEQEHTPGSMITMALAIEETQRLLDVDVRALKDPSVNQKLGFTKRRTALLKSIHKFRRVQAVYMPSVRAVLSDEMKQMFDGNGAQLPENTRLFLPSEIKDERLRGRACAVGLARIEMLNREGEATEALEAVRDGLRIRTMTNRYKLQNYTGQGGMTRGQGILRQINIRIQNAKLQYRYARAAYLVLAGHGDWEERLRMLEDDDVRALNERALTTEEKAQNKHWAELGGAVIEGGIARAATLASGEGSHTLSWIWYTAGAAGINDDQLHQALRVEWCKAYARTRRYSEEIRLLREEMRRTVEYGYTLIGVWDHLGAAADSLPDAEPELTEGRCAYAEEQAFTERERCTALEKAWRGILGKADAYIDGETELGVDQVVVEALEAGDEMDEMEEEARLEGGEDDEPCSVPFS
ncbi:hypothetical protein C8R47DRAFT_993341 [Mycena vitilis]|nr:hypothetical protein C8R47DRAFT_993341 [Mycena vitilis]